MSTFVQNIFKLLGIALVSYILIGVTFSDTSKNVIWGALEPTFQSIWRTSTFNDGELLDERITEDFNNIVEVR